jgi:hypothetical protein
MLALEKERLLLNRENPFKQTFSYERKSDIEDRSKLPILKPDRVTEKMLYYPPTHKEGEIAGSQLNSILSSWNRDCMNFPQDIVFNKMIKYNSNIDFEQRLTERGLDYIERGAEVRKKTIHYETIDDNQIKIWEAFERGDK